MATDRTEMDDLVEERPVPGALVRHRGARVTQHGVERSAPRLEVHAGALWIRATDAGPGVLASHGATTVQVREGAAVLEVSDFEALLVVVAGRVAVKGAAALPRSVTAGHAVTLNLDGGFGAPEPLSPEELRSDRFVVENLALDVLAEAAVPLDPSPASPAPAPPGALTAPTGARVDGSPPARSGAEPEPPAASPPIAAEAQAPADVPAVAAAYDPEPIAVPRPTDPNEEREEVDDDEVPRLARRGLVVVVIVLVILAAVIGALVLTGDENRSAPPASAPALRTEPVATIAAAPEATVQECAAGPSGYVAQGVVSGGEDGVARYEVTIGLEDAAGELYAEKAVTVAARTDPRTDVQWTAELVLAADEVRPGSECRLVWVEARA